MTVQENRYVTTQTRRGDVSWQAVAAILIIAAGISSIAFGDHPYVTYIVSLVAINVIATVGLNITVGYAGLLSIGHSAFIGVGAYASALSFIHLGIPPYIAVLIGGAASFLVGILFGLPSLRIRGVHLAIATLSAQFLLSFIFQRWESVTNGDRGLTVPQASIFGIRPDADIFLLIAIITIAVCLFGFNLFRTRIGRALIAIREKDYAAAVLGIDLLRYKLLAFGIGAACAGLAGGLTAFFLRIVNPEQFTLQQSVFFLGAVVVGGRGSIVGSILGAIFMTMVPELLRMVMQSISDSSGAALVSLLSPLREIIFGSLIVGFLLLERRGLVGLLGWVGIRKTDYRG